MPRHAKRYADLAAEEARLQQMRVAAFKAFGQLLNPRLRHHWEKTTHGLVVDEAAVAARVDEQVVAVA